MNYGEAKAKALMATKKTGVKCFEKADDDEPLFVLRAKDLSSPAVVCEWIKQNIETARTEKLREALEVALEMRGFGRMGGGVGGDYETKRRRAT